MKINNISPAERVKIARNSKRPVTKDYINALFEDFIPLAGDRRQGDDKSILGGIASFKGIPVTVIGHLKGRSLEENLECRFGMPNPEGYRKAERLFLQAQKFKRPVITFVDTPGAFPGLEAEERGQGEAIAGCLATLSNLEVPIISIVIGEGGSGGALALAVCDKLILLENAIFSVLSPEGFSAILWKDGGRWEEACDVMKLTAEDLINLGVGDEIVLEPTGGAHNGPEIVYHKLEEILERELAKLTSQNKQALVKNRYKKLRYIGSTRRENGRT